MESRAWTDQHRSVLAGGKNDRERYRNARRPDVDRAHADRLATGRLGCSAQSQVVFISALGQAMIRGWPDPAQAAVAHIR